MTFPDAETLPYWKTSKSTPDTWLDRAEKVIVDLGGEVQLRARGSESGREAFLMEFRFGTDRFRAVWPVLPSRDQAAARRQAATMLYHDVKGRSVRCAIFGHRLAFFEWNLLGDGRTIGQVASAGLDDVAGLLPPAK